MSCDCGTLKPVTAATTPVPQSVQEVIPAANIVAGWDAAVTTNDGATVSEMFDVSGNGFALTQAVGASQPAIVLAGGPNGNPSVLFDGVDDFLENTVLNLPAPGTTPVYYWGVFRQVTWTFPRSFWDAGAGGSLRLAQAFVSPEVDQTNGANQTSPDMPLNTYRVVALSFTNSVTDYIDISGARTTGTNAGNTNPGAGFTLGATTGPVNPGNIELCELWIFNTTPSAAQFAQLNAYAVGRYGFTVLV